MFDRWLMAAQIQPPTRWFSAPTAIVARIRVLLAKTSKQAFMREFHDWRKSEIAVLQSGMIASGGKSPLSRRRCRISPRTGRGADLRRRPASAVGAPYLQPPCRSRKAPSGAPRVWNHMRCSADILVCRFAGCPARRSPGWGRRLFHLRHRADWKVGGTADKNVCATGLECHRPRRPTRPRPLTRKPVRDNSDAAGFGPARTWIHPR